MNRITLVGFFVLLISACGGTAPKSAINKVANTIERAADSAGHYQTVTIDSPDGVKIVGSLYAATQPNSPALLLMHQWQSDRHSYDEFAAKMNDKGFAVLSIDGRGFGESAKRADGSTVAAGRTDDDVKAMLGDVDAAFNYLSKQNNVDANRIGIVGASYGSSLALIYAADHQQVATIALLSPGVNYFGNMPTGPAMTTYRSRPAFLAAAKDDPESFNAVTGLKELATEQPDRVVAVSVDKGGHGTALLSVGGVRKPLEDFLTERLGAQTKNK